MRHWICCILLCCSVSLFGEIHQVSQVYETLGIYYEGKAEVSDFVTTYDMFFSFDADSVLFVRGADSVSFDVIGISPRGESLVYTLEDCYHTIWFMHLYTNDDYTAQLHYHGNDTSIIAQEIDLYEPQQELIICTLYLHQ